MEDKKRGEGMCIVVLVLTLTPALVLVLILIRSDTPNIVYSTGHELIDNGG
jgi:hypothetical protein